MLLPILGAGLGGYEAYRQSGGNLGATMLGAGLGAVTPAGLRMAGTALGGALGAPALTRASAAVLSKAGAAGRYAQSLGTEGAKGLAGRAIQSGVVPALQNISKGVANPLALGGLAAGAGMLLGAPALAGALASKVAPAAGTAASGALGLAGSPGAASPQYSESGIPGGMGQFGYVDAYGTPLDILSPAGQAAGRRAEYDKTIEQQVNAIRRLSPELFKAAEARSKTEFQRQMAAAGVRQNIVTAANMLERSQQAAQQMGLNAAGQVGSALTSQYQYS